MSKNRLSILIIASLMVLSGCGKSTEVSKVTQDSTVVEEMQETEVVDNQVVEEENIVEEYDHNLVCDRWADSGSFKIYTSDNEFFDFDYNYSVPQIVHDTEDAEEINYLIKWLFEDMHNIIQKAAKEGRITAEEFDNTEWIQTNYDCYWNGSIASIVIYSTGYYDNETNYNVYNYDFATGKMVSNEDIFALMGITGEEFAEDLRRAAVYSLDMEMQNFFESEIPLTEDEFWHMDMIEDNVQHMYGDYLLARARTIYMDNINEYVPVYLDEQGQLQAITHLYNMSMYGEVTSILSPKNWVNNGVSTFSGDLLDVVSKDDGIYLTIYRDEWSDEMHEEFPTFEFAKEYKIDGLYKNYTEARISWVGNGKQPYILLLSDDGMISYVDVWEGIASGYFCAVEPLWGLVNIKSFSDNEESRVIALNNEGKLIDVDESLYMMLSCRYVDFEKNILNLSNVTRYSAVVNHKEAGQDVEYEELIGFTDDKYHMFIRESYKTDNYEGGAQEGYINFSGMNDKGMVFGFSLVGEEGELRGTLAINAYSYWDGNIEDFVDGADVVWISGFDIFESKGNRVILSGSVG